MTTMATATRTMYDCQLSRRSALSEVACRGLDTDCVSGISCVVRGRPLCHEQKKVLDHRSRTSSLPLLCCKIERRRLVCQGGAKECPVSLRRVCGHGLRRRTGMLIMAAADFPVTPRLPTLQGCLSHGPSSSNSSSRRRSCLSHGPSSSHHGRTMKFTDFLQSVTKGGGGGGGRRRRSSDGHCFRLVCVMAELTGQSCLCQSFCESRGFQIQSQGQSKDRGGRVYASRKTSALQTAANVSDGYGGADKGEEDEDANRQEEEHGEEMVGEDAAVFDLDSQSLSSWTAFSAILATVLAVTYYVWIDSSVGFGYGGKFVETLSSVSDNHEIVMLSILVVFAVVHSGLAALRSSGEKLMGERAYRVLFASASLPLAISAVVYFINHRYDGLQLWQVRTVPGIHELVWFLSFVSFFFLYPSTFNLLEVAAVDRPKVHLWETGIMRVTRHPQMVGQLIWCLAHTLWIGNSFTLTTSLGLCAHHLFGCWHGDKRLAERYGAAFEAVKARTSIVPFLAIIDGRQKLPDEYWREFQRLPYFVIVALTLGAYYCHPLMQVASYRLHW